MKNLILSGLLLLVLFRSNESNAQVDPHFSQFYMFPTYLNPALTGAFDGNVRLTGIYRTQWGSVGTPFKTYGLSGDFTTNKSMNFGGSVMNQTAGDGGFNYTTANASAAFTGLRWGTEGTQHLVIGVNAGIVSRNFNPSKLTFGDQWNPITGYNPGNATTESFSQTASTVFDAGVGALYYDGKAGKKANLYLGASANHITQPDDPFSAEGDATLPMRFSFHGGVRIAINEQFSLTPNALYMKQAGAEESMIGLYGQFRLSNASDLMLGVNYRHEDAVAPFLGITINGMVIGLSYDSNTSDLGRSVSGTNAFEFSVSFIGKRKVKTDVDGNFVCPRL
ncbi:MAG: PorP/SprF family type IX secretion system membrane protein [Chitinophagaceae bacterium]|nr:PorP/SprF family type IX secretion system membrane protein [Chitinophagaceae bacterium]MCU0403653.1 PorP/SprF family type IX secretion system membrane protein [Chitinophagaceae bacterium]